MFLIILGATIYMGYRQINGENDENTEIDFSLGIWQRIKDLTGG